MFFMLPAVFRCHCYEPHFIEKELNFVYLVVLEKGREQNVKNIDIEQQQQLKKKSQKSLSFACNTKLSCFE